MIANIHKASFNKFFNNVNISIQSAYARHSGVQANTFSENLFCKDLATEIFLFGRAQGYSERVEETWYEISYTNVTQSHVFLRGLLSLIRCIVENSGRAHLVSAAQLYKNAERPA